MPKFDGTGPRGQGAGTGRGLGDCRGGARRCWGCRGNWGFGFGGFASSKNRLATLEAEEETLEERLKAIKEGKAAIKEQQE